MVAFTGNGLVRTAKAANTSNTNNKRPQNSDRLVTVESYDLSRSVMRVKEEITTKDGTTKLLTHEAHIDQESIDRNNKSAAEKNLENTVKFKGHLIDEKMAKDIPVGSKVVLEKSQILKKLSKDNEDIFILSAQRVINAPNPEPEKTFVGLFTVSGWGERIRFVQHWAERALDITDEGSLGSLRQQMDEALQTYGTTMFEKAVVHPSIGIQLRAIKPFSDPQNPDVKYQVIDTSGALDWIPEMKDDAGNTVSKGHPLDPENFDQYLQGYSDHIAQNFADEDGVRVEVCPYFNYLASPMSTTLALKDNRWDPITQMATCQTRLSQDPESVVTGKNWAVKGIIQISGDRMVKVSTKQVEFVPTFYVNKLHANNIKGHVHSWVASSDGQKTVPHPSLKRIREDLPENQNRPAQDGQASGATQSHSASSHQESAPSDDGFFDDPFDSSVRPRTTP